MSSKPNPKAFMYLAVGAVVLGGGICYFEYSKLSGEQANVAKLKTQVSDPKDVQKKLDDSNMKLEGARQSLAHLEGNVSSAAYVPSLLRDLDNYGKQNQISVTGVKPTPKQNAATGQPDPKKPYDELIIQVTGNGSFEAIKSFLDNLPKFPKIVAAHMLSIEPVHATGPDVPKGQLAMTVELKAYVFKSDDQSRANASTTPGANPPSNGTTTTPTATTPAPSGTPTTIRQATVKTSATPAPGPLRPVASMPNGGGK